MTERFLRTNEYCEVRDTLRACLDFYEKSGIDRSYWKWLIIGIHSAVQGCMVIALTHSDGSGAVIPRDAKAWNDALLNDTDLPKLLPKLMCFPELYERIKMPGRIDYSQQHFVPTPSHDRSIKRLNEYRNEFIHYSPKDWSLDLPGIPRLVRDCLEVCSFLISASGRFRIFSEYQEGELKALVAAVSERCGGIHS
jgi:hypothetical protein